MDEQLSTDKLEIELDLPPGQVPEEGVLSKRQINTPSRQGSTVPMGWKPTLQKPVPVVRCNYVWPDTHVKGGNRCNRWSLRGSLLCYIHSGRGNLKNVEDYRQAILESARLQMTDAVPEAIEWLVDLAANSGADNVRLKAITELLDRTGIRSGSEVDVNVTVNEGVSPLTTLAERLAKLKEAADAVQAMQQKAREEHDRLALEAGDPAVAVPDPTDDEDIVDAEVVADETNETNGDT